MKSASQLAETIAVDQAVINSAVAAVAVSEMIRVNVRDFLAVTSASEVVVATAAGRDIADSATAAAAEEELAVFPEFASENQQTYLRIPLVLMNFPLHSV